MDGWIVGGRDFPLKPKVPLQNRFTTLQTWNGKRDRAPIRDITKRPPRLVQLLLSHGGTRSNLRSIKEDDRALEVVVSVSGAQVACSSIPPVKRV